jgi:hypothetical protein
VYFLSKDQREFTRGERIIKETPGKKKPGKRQWRAQWKRMPCRVQLLSHLLKTEAMLTVAMMRIQGPAMQLH